MNNTQYKDNMKQDLHLFIKFFIAYILLHSPLWTILSRVNVLQKKRMIITINDHNHILQNM